MPQPETPWEPPPGVVAWTAYALNDGTYPATLTRFTNLDGNPWDAPDRLIAGVFQLTDEGSDNERLYESSRYVHLKVANIWKGSDEDDIATMLAHGIEFDAVLHGYETYFAAFQDALDAMFVDPHYPNNTGRPNFDRDQLRWLNKTLELEVTSREKEIRNDERAKHLRELVAAGWHGPHGNGNGDGPPGQ